MNLDKLEAIVQEATGITREPMLKVLKPSEIIEYNPAQEPILIGDAHVARGDMFVIGGEPGVGKSRLAISMALAGARGGVWMGLEVKQQFRTLILQTENGRYRLKRDFDEIGIEGLDAWIRISEPPPYGLNFNSPEFQIDLQRILAEFKPHLVLLDPWNAVARDDKQKDYQESFEAILQSLPLGEDKPALGIVAHTRKPHPGEKQQGGSQLLHTLAGSHVLSSRPRCVWIMVRGTQDETDNSVVLFNPKNNDGREVAPTAWARKNGCFQALEDFDWDQFLKPPDERRSVTEADLAEVLHDKPLSRAEAVQRLMNLTGLKHSACYAALTQEGKFSRCFKEAGGLLQWR